MPRQAIDAAWVYATADGVRRGHSDLVHGMNWANTGLTDDSYRSLLARHSRELLD